MQRHLRQEGDQFVSRFHAIDEQARRNQVEQIFAGVDPAAEEIWLERAVDRWGLGDGAGEALGLGVCELGCPIGAKTLAMDDDAIFVDFRPWRDNRAHAINLVEVSSALRGACPVPGLSTAKKTIPSEIAAA